MRHAFTPSLFLCRLYHSVRITLLKSVLHESSSQPSRSRPQCHNPSSHRKHPWTVFSAVRAFDSPRPRPTATDSRDIEIHSCHLTSFCVPQSNAHCSCLNPLPYLEHYKSRPSLGTHASTSIFLEEPTVNFANGRAPTSKLMRREQTISTPLQGHNKTRKSSQF